MYDINNHPAREKLNKEIGTVLGKTIRELYKISKRYNVDRKEVIEQFEISMRLFTEKGEQVMSIGKEVTEGMMGAFLMDGVEIQRRNKVCRGLRKKYKKGIYRIRNFRHKLFC